MGKIIAIFLFLFVSVAGQAQFTNTKWKGVLELEPAMDVLFDFRKDTVEVFNLADNTSLEIMKYTVKDSILSLQKISGGSGCNDTNFAKYKFRLKDDQFFLIRVEDDCDDRANVLNNTTWKRQQ